MKKIILLFVLILVGISFIGCNPEEETTTTNSTTDTTTQVTTTVNTTVPTSADLVTTTEDITQKYTISDFYSQLISCKEHIDNIIGEYVVEQSAIFTQNIIELGYYMSDTEYTQTYTREQILEAHYNASFDLVYDDYLEQLINTELFISDVKSVIESDEEIQLFVPFHPNGDASITYEFIMSESGYILIDALYYTQHSYLKMGVMDDLLEYQEFHYFYETGSMNPKDDIELVFNYFKFLENEEAVYINYLGDVATLRYTNIQSDEQFSISLGNNIIEGPEEVQSGYVLNMYDRETNVRSYLQIANNEIVGETYDVFDEYGQVYRYDNYDFYDGQKSLQINVATATGWDYVVASDYSDPEIDELTGVYLNDGTKIFDGRMNCTYTPTYGFVGLWLNFDENDEITDEIFSMNQFGMNLDHPKANVEFLNQIRLSNVEQVKSRFQIENLDFFTEDLHQELYNFIDQDIRDDIEGVNDEPIITTGDVEEFEDALDQFNANLSETPNYQTNTLVTTTIYDQSGNVFAESSTTSIIDFDLNAMYYRDYTNAGSRNYSYIIDGTQGQLIEFEWYGMNAKYYILDEEATTSSFMQAYGDVTNKDETFDDMLNGVKSIEQINATTFELSVTSKFLSGGGVDIDILLEQMGITGLGDQTIIVTFEFNEDFTDFEVTYVLGDLSFDDYTLEISSVSLTEIKPVTVISPQNQEYVHYYLPQSINQTTYEKASIGGRYVLYEGYSYMRIYLEPGEYSVDVYGLHNYPTVSILDSDLNMLEYDMRFEATYEGYYYVKIYSNTEQNADIIIRDNPSPTFTEFDIFAEDGVLEEYVDLIAFSFYSIVIPSATTERLIILHPYIVEVLSEEAILELWIEMDEINYHDGCIIDETKGEVTCYLYLPANYDIIVDLNGYFTGTFGFEYEYFDIPQGAFDNNHTWTDLTETLMLWITDDSPVAHVDFTITEAGLYELNTFYKDYGYSYHYAELYSSDGTKITYDWDNSISLQPGDYYIEFIPGYTSTLKVLIITEIIKH